MHLYTMHLYTLHLYLCLVYISIPCISIFVWYISINTKGVSYSSERGLVNFLNRWISKFVTIRFFKLYWFFQYEKCFVNILKDFFNHFYTTQLYTKHLYTLHLCLCFVYKYEMGFVYILKESCYRFESIVAAYNNSR